MIAAATVGNLAGRGSCVSSAEHILIKSPRVKSTMQKKVRICVCGHDKAKHGTRRKGTHCRRCKCTVHPNFKIDEYEISACILYPEQCHGICWMFQDKRGLLTRIVDALIGR